MSSYRLVSSIAPRMQTPGGFTRDPWEVHAKALRNVVIMELNVGIVREGKELEEGIEALQELKKRVANVKAHPTSQYNPGWNTCIDLRNMITSAEATALCALQREESRGEGARRRE